MVDAVVVGGDRELERWAIDLNNFSARRLQSLEALVETLDHSWLEAFALELLDYTDAQTLDVLGLEVEQDCSAHDDCEAENATSCEHVWEPVPVTEDSDNAEHQLSDANLLHDVGVVELLSSFNCHWLRLNLAGAGER